jgi:hypothetical protein
MEGVRKKGNTEMQTIPDQELVARRAREIWEAEGRPEGRHAEHWRQAEQEFTPAEGGPPEAGKPSGGDAAEPEPSDSDPVVPVAPS